MKSIQINCYRVDCTHQIIFVGYNFRNIFFDFVQIDCVIDVGDIGDVGDCSRSFGAIVDIFYFRYVGDIIDDYLLNWCLNNFLNKIGVRSFVYYFPCICACVKYLRRRCIQNEKKNKIKINKLNWIELKQWLQM